MIEALIRWGMSRNEAMVYIACFELGTATSAQIAMQVGLSIDDAYLSLARFRDMRLVSGTTIDGNFYYSPNHPRRLSEILEELRVTAEHLWSKHGQTKN